MSMADYYEKSYKDIWKPTCRIGKKLKCVREPTNVINRYAVSVTKDETTAGHLPKKISRIHSLFVRHGGLAICEVIGTRCHSSDLVQGD